MANMRPSPPMATAPSEKASSAPSPSAKGSRGVWITWARTISTATCPRGRSTSAAWHRGSNSRRRVIRRRGSSSVSSMSRFCSRTKRSATAWSRNALRLVVVAVHVEQRTGLAVPAELGPGPHLEQLVQRAEAAGQRDEGVGELGHEGLALVHRVHHAQVGYARCGRSPCPPAPAGSRRSPRRPRPARRPRARPSGRRARRRRPPRSPRPPGRAPARPWSRRRRAGHPGWTRRRRRLASPPERSQANGRPGRAGASRPVSRRSTVAPTSASGPS